MNSRSRRDGTPAQTSASLVELRETSASDLDVIFEHQQDADVSRRASPIFDAHGIVWSDFTGKPRSIQTRFDGIRQIFVQDPDGYWIEISDALGTPQR